MVWVRPSMLPAKMIVAPNSPSARTQARIAPEPIAEAASGSITRAKTAVSPAPSTRAASS